VEENTLYYGDNLDILRRYIEDESIDLIYLDPPFNSNQEFNVLFAERNGTQAAAQIKAFEDTWHWDQSAALAYQEVVENGPDKASRAMQAFRELLSENDMMAYLAMMAPRLIEMRRVLKSTGALYLHCDPNASHFIKILLDSIFGFLGYRNEIIWKRTTSHGNVINKHGWIHDVIFFYTKSEKWAWNQQYTPYDEEYVKNTYKHIEPGTGRRYASDNITAPMSRASKGQIYDWKGYRPGPTRCWIYAKEKMEGLDKEGRLLYAKTGSVRYKRYLDEMPGVKTQDIWADISIPPKTESLGYPTQKPEALLERIILASSNEGGVVLDPFCGCGTAVVTAHKLNRKWIGIDITHLAITLIKHRLQDAFGNDVKYKVVGEPTALTGAKALAKEDPFQFQWWALGLVGARPIEQKKGADKGIDGRLYFHEELKGKTNQIILSVKSGHTGVSHVRDLRGVIDREKAEIGVLISLQEPTRPMITEAATAGFYHSPLYNKKYPKIQLLTIEELFNGKVIDCPPFKRSNIVKKAQRVKIQKGKQKQIRDWERFESL